MYGSSATSVQSTLYELFFLFSSSTVKWCLDNSISSHVTTPISLQDLCIALITALDSNTISPVAETTDVVYDILLAEDNLVNQKLAVRILEKYGHEVDIAENGSLAVDKYKKRILEGRTFDLILASAFFCPQMVCLCVAQMDVSMPFMGGMEATELIRTYEQTHGLEPTPIIALTAHASTYFLRMCVVEPELTGRVQ